MTTKPATKEKTAKAATEDFKYGVADVAEALDIEPASARVQLRNHNIKKAGKSYGWNSKTELEDVVKKIKAEKAPAKAKAEKKTAPAKKPAVAVKKVKKEAA